MHLFALHANKFGIGLAETFQSFFYDINHPLFTNQGVPMISKALISEFNAILGNKHVMSDMEDRAVYAYDAAVLEPVVPALVIRPTTSENLSRAVRLCNENGLPLTVRGAGTNLSGGTIPSARGVVLVTNGLNRILQINTADMYAVVQPGVITADLMAAVEAHGLFYPPDPGSMKVSTIGGNVAENAGGLRGLKYGVTAHYVMGLKFFDVNGEPVKTGSRTVKCATGYNLTGLMVGSEGTLGVFDEIILKLIPAPHHHRAMLGIFNSMAEASQTVAAIIAERIVPATLEIMDNFTIRAVEEYSRAGLPVNAASLLLIEMDGHRAQVEEDSQKVEALCRQMGADAVRVARDENERDKVWAARRSALSALAKLKPSLVLEDATVPRSQIPAMVQAIQEIGRRFNLSIGTFGHAGDGNLHPTILTDRRDQQEWHRVEQAIAAIFEKALALGGTLSGEHGTGIAKARFLEKETSRATLVYSRRVKQALDPKGILNPGKIIGE